jgi:ATP-dependent exoDNAse (exonuclease V) beta subunit
VAFKLIGDGHSVNIAGSDIGFKLVGIMRRLGNSEMNQRQTLSAINDWEAEKLANESTTASDMAACMRVFAKQADSLSLAISYAEHLFKQSGLITLMTGHKSKGLEYPYIIHLDPQLLGASEQDLNLRYVISTRSQDQLVEIASDRIVW